MKDSSWSTKKSLRRRDRETRLAAAIKRANVEHILDAVGRKHVPDFINRRRLREDIDNIGKIARTYADLDDDRLSRNRLKRLQEVERTARKLRSQLSDEDGRWVRQKLGPGFPLGEGEFRRKRKDRAPSISGLMFGSARLARLARRERGRSSPYAPVPQDRSAPEWLIGVHLPEIYHRYFLKPPGVGRSHDPINELSGEANSPYIRFAEAVLTELGITTNRGAPYRRETISREFQRARSGEQPRRKSRGRPTFETPTGETDPETAS